MQVVSQSKDYTFNFRNRDVKVVDERIYVVTNTGSQLIGAYACEVRSGLVLQEMLASNQRLGLDEIYQMPKE